MLDKNFLYSLLDDTAGKTLILDCVDSTNSYAKRIAAGSDTFAVIAERQSGGRGRLGRFFESPEGGLYISFILRERIDVARLPMLTAYVAVAVSHAIETETGLASTVKWVNDILICDKKVCGILCESVFVGDVPKYTVVGVGVNCRNYGDGGDGACDGTSGVASQKRSTLCFDLSDGLSSSAVCVRGEKLTERLAAAIAQSLEGAARELENGSFIDEYRRRSCVIGKRVSVIEPATSRFLFSGLAVGIDDDCRLLVKPDGVEKTALEDENSASSGGSSVNLGKKIDGDGLIALSSGEVSIRLGGDGL